VRNISGLDYEQWSKIVKRKVEEEKIKIKFDLPPKNPKDQEVESCVIFMFGQIYDVLGMSEIQFASRFPDCTALWNGEKVSIEFEYHNGQFKNDHKNHVIPSNLIIICWENRWKSCPYPVIELKRVYLR
jgi:hypothetical protein